VQRLSHFPRKCPLNRKTNLTKRGTRILRGDEKTGNGVKLTEQGKRGGKVCRGCCVKKCRSKVGTARKLNKLRGNGAKSGLATSVPLCCSAALSAKGGGTGQRSGTEFFSNHEDQVDVRQKGENRMQVPWAHKMYPAKGKSAR